MIAAHRLDEPCRQRPPFARRKTASRANPAVNLPYRPRARATPRRPSRNYRCYDWSASSGSVVGNDPIDGRDPSGEQCVTNADKGTTTCSEAVTGSNILSKVTFQTNAQTFAAAGAAAGAILGGIAGGTGGGAAGAVAGAACGPGAAACSPAGAAAGATAGAAAGAAAGAVIGGTIGGLIGSAIDKGKVLLNEATGQAPLKGLHSKEAMANNRSSTDYWRGRSTGEITQSLRPGQAEALRVKGDGTIMNGNTRIQILRERGGIDVNNLPREPYP